MPLPGGLLPGNTFPGGTVGPITLTDSGQRIYDAITPLMAQDAENGYAGAILSGALATMLDKPAYFARGVEGEPGAVIFDVDNVDASWLPWLSQFVGDSSAVQNTTDVATQRALIKAPTNFLRGRPSTFVKVGQTTLTGTKTVLVYQNSPSAPWGINIITFTSETPNPTATKNAFLSVMPAWLVPTIQVLTGGNYTTLAGSHTSYSAMEAAHTHYSDIPTNPAA